MNKDRKMSSILKGYRPKWDAMEGAEKFYDSFLKITGSQNIFFKWYSLRSETIFDN